MNQKLSKGNVFVGWLFIALASCWCMVSVFGSLASLKTFVFPQHPKAYVVKYKSKERGWTVNKKGKVTEVGVKTKKDGGK
jgi:hypothetical protein